MSDLTSQKTNSRRARYSLTHVFIYKYQTRHIQAGLKYLQTVDDGPVLEPLDVLFGLVQARLLLHTGRGALHQLHKVMTVNFVHDAKHASAVVTDPLQVPAFAGEGLGCRRRNRDEFRCRDEWTSCPSVLLLTE